MIFVLALHLTTCSNTRSEPGGVGEGEKRCDNILLFAVKDTLIKVDSRNLKGGVVVGNPEHALRFLIFGIGLPCSTDSFMGFLAFCLFMGL